MPRSGEPPWRWGIYNRQIAEALLLIIRTGSCFNVDVEEQQGLYGKEGLFWNTNIKKKIALYCKFCKFSATIVGLYMNFSGPNNFQSLQLMLWDNYNRMKSLSEASWGSLLAPKLLNCVCFIHLCTAKSCGFSVLLHYDKHLSYITHLL